MKKKKDKCDGRCDECFYRCICFEEFDKEYSEYKEDLKYGLENDF